MEMVYHDGHSLVVDTVVANGRLQKVRVFLQPVAKPVRLMPQGPRHACRFVTILVG